MRLENSDGKYEGFKVGTYDDETPGLIKKIMLGVADYYKLEKGLGLGSNESDSEGIKEGTQLG